METGSHFPECVGVYLRKPFACGGNQAKRAANRVGRPHRVGAVVLWEPDMSDAER